MLLCLRLPLCNFRASSVWIRKCSSVGSPHLLTAVENEDGVRWITLNDSKRRNALSLSMIRELRSALDCHAATRVVVISANGPAFSSGHDLQELTSASGAAKHRKIFEECKNMLSHLKALPFPVVAEVKGVAAAAGCQLCASCDIVVAGENARFATNGINAGFFCSTPGVALTRNLPIKLASLMLFTGQFITAQEALRHGLVSKVASDESLRGETKRIVHTLCQLSRPALALGKNVLRQQIELSTDDAYQIATEAMLENLQLEDCQEGIKAFFEKRPPVWKS